MYVTVKVTKVDISKGIPGDPYLCPVNIAVNKVLVLETGKTVLTSVPSGYNEKRLVKGPDICNFTYPNSVTKFILDFDKGLPVKPFEFKINVKKSFIKPKVLKALEKAKI